MDETNSDSNLMLEGVKLENNKTVNDYLIHENATLDILFYQRRGIIIFIENTDKFTPIVFSLLQQLN